jgi:hypothetical protein
MINYDLPWNPTRLEQRLGRIHRIGQERDCYVFNFVATESEEGHPVIEGRILQRLLQKLEQMREALSDRVYDVIGEVLSLNDINLLEMLRQAAYDPRRLDEYIDQIDRLDPIRLKEYEEATGIALARSIVDFSDFQHRNLEVEERRLMPCFVESFFLDAAREVGLKMDLRADGLWRLEHVPLNLRSERLRSVQRLGKAESSYRKITFHKQHLEQDAHLDAVLLGPGHPLYAAVDEHLNERLAPLLGGISCYLDPLASESYLLHFFEITIRGKEARGKDAILYGELVAVREEAGAFEMLPIEHFLNLPPHPKPPVRVEPAAWQPAADFLKGGYQLECRSRCQEERQGYAQIIREYLKNSFDKRLKKAQVQAMRLLGEAGQKPEYKLAADEASRRVKELEQDRDDRLAGLARLKVARTGPVRHLATALVLPPSDLAETEALGLSDEPEPHLSRKIELAAEDLVVAALHRDGFPQDRIQRIGHLKRGFDLRAHRILDTATGEIDVRRIEVKGRARGQTIRLTLNEWYKAQQLADTYWLYVVWDPLGESPEMVYIQNPAARLDHAKRQIISGRYIEIPAGAIWNFVLSRGPG